MRYFYLDNNIYIVININQDTYNIFMRECVGEMWASFRASVTHISLGEGNSVRVSVNVRMNYVTTSKVTYMDRSGRSL